MRVLHCITNLGQGGAEAVLFRLIAASSNQEDHVVVSLMEEAYYGPRLREMGVTVHALGFPKGRVTLKGLRKLRRLILETKPSIVQTWMYHADLVGGMVARLAGVRAVVWGIRNSLDALDQMSVSTRLAVRVCAWVSYWIPAAIACNSARAAEAHQRLGYSAEKFVVIPNGYDLVHFSPQPKARARIRAEWGVSSDEMLLGMVARWNPQKDHENLLAALAKLAQARLGFRCALVGTDMDWDNVNLTELVHRHGLKDRLILTGPRDDIPDVMNALDLHVLSSAGEAFPNTVAEAMACGVPCVVTDVGDAALIVGDTGWVVPPRNAEALSQGIELGLLALNSFGRDHLSFACRRRIEDQFGIGRMVGSYVKLWHQVGDVGVKG